MEDQVKQEVFLNERDSVASTMRELIKDFEDHKIEKSNENQTDSEKEEAKKAAVNKLESKKERLVEISLAEKLLPSQVTDENYIVVCQEEYLEDEEFLQAGKWMLFAQSDLKLLDSLWNALLPLYKGGSFIKLKASTAGTPEKSGVVSCYTANADDITEAKRVADAIRERVNYEYVMYYKTNTATAEDQFSEKKCKNVSMYMHTLKGGLYVRDELKRWKLISL